MFINVWRQPFIVNIFLQLICSLHAPTRVWRSQSAADMQQESATAYVTDYSALVFLNHIIILAFFDFFSVISK